MVTPPSRFPRTPPMEEAIQTKDWSSPEEDACFFLEEEVGCLPISATMASLATSTIEAPRLLRSRYRVIVKIEMFDEGRIAIASHDTACRTAAATIEQNKYEKNE